MSLVVKNMDDLEQIDETELEDLYSWVDKIPLSRPKRNISRDFSDGVTIAELVKHFLPHIVSLHNYTPANAAKKKLDNWRQLNSFRTWHTEVPFHLADNKFLEHLFSVLVAEVIKHFLPKMIDIHNYTPGSSTPQKMQNWFLMNRKVFCKLNFQLTEDLIRELCLGKIGLIERFLMHLRAKIEKANWDLQKDSGERKEMAERVTKATQKLYTNPKASKSKYNDKPEADQDISSPGRPKQPHPVQDTYRGQVKTRSSEETVSRAVYEEKEQECLSKEETIQILQAKVRRLEHLLQLKDLRIEDLQNKVEGVKPAGKGMR